MAIDLSIMHILTLADSTAAATAGATAPTFSITGALSASPPVLFFFLGMFAALVRSNLSVPKAVTKLLSLYMLWSIGFQGGVKLVHGGMTYDVMAGLGAGMLLACVIPVYSFFLLRLRLNADNAAAVAASYGSISAVTFVTAGTVLAAHGIAYGGHMVAAMALMESPAIVISVVLWRTLGGAGNANDAVVPPPATDAGLIEDGEEDAATDLQHNAASAKKFSWGKLLHEAFFNGPVLLMLGSMLIGMFTGEAGYKAFKPLCTDIFSGVLVFFLLDLGLLAARRLKDLKQAGVPLIAYGIIAPLVHAAVALGLAKALALSVGDGVMLMVLAASASYIAVPAAIRLIIPKANPGIYIPMALAVTFPFNVAIGIPLYLLAGQWILR